MFTSKFNTMTGALDWEIQNYDYDYQQELARAGFADMLHDHERNRLYYAGLSKVIRKLKSEKKTVNVLDIGTGTGLLSMMAVVCGADTVTACEAFKPMVTVAKKCIEANGMKDKIKIIEKRSTDIVIGIDMDQKANVLVTEVFDTELIGEGAISTFTHALDNLLVTDCYVVPDNAIMYVQIVDSQFCHDWNWLDLSKYNLKVPEDCKKIAGDAIFDVQLTQLNEFKALTEPIEVFRFSFSGKKPISFNERNIIEAVSKHDGRVAGIFMWWVLRMDYENEILLSCAPSWAHHAPNDMQWRDHWMQAIYFPNKLIDLKINEKFLISCQHDEYSLKFDVHKYCEKEKILNSQHEIEEIDLGTTLVSRNRLAQLNNKRRNDLFVNILKKYETGSKQLLIANDDFSILPILAASETKYDRIYVLESNRFRKRCLLSILTLNKLEERVIIIDKNLTDVDSNDLINAQFDIILSESSFNSVVLPWDNLYFYYGLEHLRSLRSDNSGVIRKIIPFKLRLFVIAISMKNLDNIRSPVGMCEGFDLSEFDRVILEASSKSDGFMEPHPLWEYPSKPLSDSVEVFEFNFNSQGVSEPLKKIFKFGLKENGLLNGFALWHVLELDEDNPSNLINTGLLKEPEFGKNLIWSKEYKQAVHIMEKKVEINDSNRLNSWVVCNISFEPVLGKFNIDFKIEN